MKYEINQVVGVKSRQGVVDCVIAEARYIRKGRSAGEVEYRLAPLQKIGKAYAVNCVGEHFFTTPKAKWSEEQVKAALGTEQTVRQEVVEKKAERVERGREALGDVYWKSRDWDGKYSCANVAVGDQVLIGYTNGKRRWETVAEVNYRTGKVGIERVGVNKTASELAKLVRMAGRKMRGPSVVRWLEATLVLEVKKPEEKLPCSITDRATEEIAAKGWSQMKFTNGEFIVSSYVVAVEAAKALNGETLECGSKLVKYDPGLKLYWRSTGSLD
jgi:hypothetical protein